MLQKFFRLQAYVYLLSNLQLTWEPGLATIVTAKFGNGAQEILMVEPKADPLLPLQHGKVVARAKAFNDVGVAPGSGILYENDTAPEVTIVDLELYIAEGESSKRGTGSLFSRVEIAFAESRLKSHR